ncbi:hypothetical protein DNG35_08490 [Mesonia sp. K7]|nr:hypothetical protein DNG35_08490 [Mesonia sp. K7]
MAILILLSTTSFTIQKHFCGDFLIDSAVFTALEKCSKEPCSGDAKDTSIAKPDCCNDVVDLVEGQDVVTTKNYDDLEYEQQVFLFAFTQSYFQLYEYLPTQVIPHQNYTPPTLVTDVQVSHQVFLI